jgi:hypothetical protein
MSLVAIAALLAMGSAPALAAKAGQQNNFNRGAKRVVTVPAPERAARVRDKPKPSELRGIERNKVKEALSQRGMRKAVQIKRKARRAGS